MSTNIHPYLIARLYAIQEAFAQPGLRSGYSTGVSKVAPAPEPVTPKSWDDLLKEDDDKSGGGGGTIKGLRGKHAEAAKAAMRRMTRR